MTADTSGSEQAQPEPKKSPLPDAEESSSADTTESKPEESKAPAAESAVGETVKSEAEDVVSTVEKADEPSTPTETAKPSSGPETPTSDKKRPLEDDEDDGDDHEPGAKLPRMHSPDKVVIHHQVTLNRSLSYSVVVQVVEESHESETVPSETEATSNDESSATSAEQELVEHNTPGGEQTAPQESDCQ